MRVPVYEELRLPKIDVMAIVDSLRRAKAGQSPLTLNLRGKTQEELVQLLKVLEDALNIIKVSPKFPYPIYVFTEHTQVESIFPLLKSPEDLPLHFLRKVKKLTNKELSLLNKSITLTQKILNQPISQRQKELKKSLKHHKELFNLSKELSFYESIQKKMAEKKS